MLGRQGVALGRRVVLDVAAGGLVEQPFANVPLVGAGSPRQLVGRERAEEIDYFDRLQLASVLKVCRESRSLSDAGRALFTASRGRKKSVNDADRLRKYLMRFGLEWRQLKDML